MSKGSVDLSINAARVLNRYAAKLGADFRFSAKQELPIHPVG